MMSGEGPIGPIAMGGMFTVLKVHKMAPRFRSAAEYSARVRLPDDLGWYDNPPGSVAESIDGPAPSAEPQSEMPAEHRH